MPLLRIAGSAQPLGAGGTLRVSLRPGARCTSHGPIEGVPSCGHRFFRERYSNKELTQLYGGYREDAYLKARQRWEPWYSARLNGAGLDPQVIAGRQNQLRELLRQVGWRQGERRVVVDVGGDAGQFIPLDLAS